jgi:CheY-like chemotaxis protein
MFEEPVRPASDPAPLIEEVADDRHGIGAHDSSLLIVDNDLSFARFLVDLAHEHKFKALTTGLGAAALALAKERNPSAITLDICLPDIDGWRILDRLKNDMETRHIPVYIITTEEERERGLKMGAIGVLTKPIKDKETLDRALKAIRSFVERPVKNLLLVEPEDEQRAGILELVGSDDTQILEVSGGDEALAALGRDHYECVVLGPGFSGGNALELADQVSRNPGLRDTPMILYSLKDLTPKEEAQFKRMARGMTLKHVRSAERLLDQTSLFLHRFVGRLPESRVRMLRRLHETDAVLAGKKVLIVDDDIRNIFAMTSMLEHQNMTVLSAETGKEAIEILKRNPGIDIVLMDIMMPEMDGYDTTRAIRRIPRFKSLPIVAVTAKAMKGDREKCIEAGAWDYLSKPVDSEQMLSVLRAWLYR